MNARNPTSSTDKVPSKVSNTASPERLPLGDGTGTWREATDALLDCVRANADDSSRKFTPAWSRWQQARLLAIDRHARAWAECTVLLSPTASTTYPGDGGLIPPVPHYEHLDASADVRQKALSRALRDVQQWRAVRVVGSTETGHNASHVALYCSDPVTPARFEPWIQSHVDNCALATTDAHGSGTVRVEKDPSTAEETGVIGYLMVNVPGLDTRGDRRHGLADEPRHRALTAAVVEAVEANPVRLGRITSS